MNSGQGWWLDQSGTAQLVLSGNRGGGCQNQRGNFTKVSIGFLVYWSLSIGYHFARSVAGKWTNASIILTVNGEYYINGSRTPKQTLSIMDQRNMARNVMLVNNNYEYRC